MWPWLKEFKLDHGIGEKQTRRVYFSWTQTLVLIAGGICEFLISLFIILAFSAALKANINQGIGTSLITLNAIFASILSYCLFREKITCMNGLGIVVILAALVLIALFGPTNDKEIDVLHP